MNVLSRIRRIHPSAVAAFSIAVFLVLVPIRYAHAQVLTVEREALIALYNATNGAGWTNNSGWVTATVGTECTWYGVTCGGGQVTALILSNNQLSGVMPTELGNLSRLFYLIMAGNQLTGSIPPELGSLPKLTNLVLASNQLSGSIPAELENLPTLNQMNLSSNQLSGSIPPELGNIPNLRYLLDLSSNQLTGSIPAELGDLLGLWRLDLNSNQLSGSIPPELGNLSVLQYLDLSDNQLSGSIPPQLGDLSSLYLERLYLNSNQLNGSIPSQLGNLSSLRFLHMHGNQLSGNIPDQLGNLSTLGTGYGLDLRWNALHSNNPTLIAFLDSKQYYGDWQSTQTIAPVNLTFDRVGDHTVWLSWDAVSYQSDPGSYSVFSAPAGTGVWTTGGWTEAKTDITYPVTGLDPATPYDFAVISYTDPHANNLNLVISDFSLQVTATTANMSCGRPIIEVAWGDPIVLSVFGSYTSYLWSTGETDPSILIDPLFEQWYWVTVTSAGPCEETAATSVNPATLVFADGFESGNTSTWSNTVP